MEKTPEKLKRKIMISKKFARFHDLKLTTIDL